MSPSDAPSKSLSTIPSARPSAVPTMAPSVPMGPPISATRQELIDKLSPIYPGIPSSPEQDMALDWLESAAPKKIDGPLFELVQSFALLVLYYDTNADDTTLDWLSSSNECNWFGISCTGGEVDRVEMGTCKWGLGL